MGVATTFEGRLAAQAERVRASGSLGRSDTLLRLFDFLVAQTLAGHAPKEIQIAQDVFDKHGGFDVMLDASVRVYIHRLRRKIDDFYDADSGGGDRLSIPKGEYRLALEDAVAPVVAEAVAEPITARRTFAWTGRQIAIALAVILALNAAAWFAFVRTAPADNLAEIVRSRFWHPLASNGRPTILVTGDYYIFGEAPDSIEVARLVREFSINSKDDLDQYLMAHPAQMGRYVDMGLHYLPTSIPQALRDLLPVVAEATGGRRGQELIVPMSQLTPDMLKKANIVYIGYLSALGLLRDPVFAASSFRIGASYDELIDGKTGKHYVSDQGDATASTPPQRDYAYVASLPGPAGSRVLIVAGTRDAAVLQAAEIASDPRQLDRIAGLAGGASAFEALYEVRTLGSLNFGSKMVVARGLRSDWLSNLDQPRPPRFPDQLAPPR